MTSFPFFGPWSGDGGVATVARSVAASGGGVIKMIAIAGTLGSPSLVSGMRSTVTATDDTDRAL